MKVTIETPPIEAPPMVVVLEMSKEEAASLLTICAHIGGSAILSRRGHFDNFAKVLRGAGIRHPTREESGTNNKGSIYFHDVDPSCL